MPGPGPTRSSTTGERTKTILFNARAERRPVETRSAARDRRRQHLGHRGPGDLQGSKPYLIEFKGHSPFTDVEQIVDDAEGLVGQRRPGRHLPRNDRAGPRRRKIQPCVENPMHPRGGDHAEREKTRPDRTHRPDPQHDLPRPPGRRKRGRHRLPRSAELHDRLRAAADRDDAADRQPRPDQRRGESDDQPERNPDASPGSNTRANSGESLAQRALRRRRRIPAADLVRSVRRRRRLQPAALRDHAAAVRTHDQRTEHQHLLRRRPGAARTQHQLHRPGPRPEPGRRQHLAGASLQNQKRAAGGPDPERDRRARTKPSSAPGQPQERASHLPVRMGREGRRGRRNLRERRPGARPKALPLADNTLHLVSTTITGLEPGTTYHFRIVATNTQTGDSRRRGADRTFTTRAAPPAPQSCPNETSRVGRSANLPDCRVLRIRHPGTEPGRDHVQDIGWVHAYGSGLRPTATTSPSTRSTPRSKPSAPTSSKRRSPERAPTAGWDGRIAGPARTSNRPANTPVRSPRRDQRLAGLHRIGRRSPTSRSPGPDSPAGPRPLSAQGGRHLHPDDAEKRRSVSATTRSPPPRRTTSTSSSNRASSRSKTIPTPATRSAATPTNGITAMLRMVGILPEPGEAMAPRGRGHPPLDERQRLDRSRPTANRCSSRTTATRTSTCGSTAKKRSTSRGRSARPRTRTQPPSRRRSGSAPTATGAVHQPLRADRRRQHRRIYKGVPGPGRTTSTSTTSKPKN